MIGQVQGILLTKQPPELLIDVNGIGYEINAPMSTFYHLPEVGNRVTLLTHLIVREDAHHLYGFATQEERSLFRILLKVNGVGPKLALTILSSIEPDEFVRSITHQDTAGLTRIPGVGKKTADRLIIEMRDKFITDKKSVDELKSSDPKIQARHHIIQDAISALIALGYKSQEASRAVSKVDDGQFSSEEIIRYALREMV